MVVVDAGPCDCCQPSSSGPQPVTVTACGITFTVSGQLAVTVTGSTNAPNWVVGDVWVCNYCGQQTIGTTTYLTWQSARPAPSGCCPFFVVLMQVTATQIILDVFETDVSCYTAGSLPPCTPSGLVENSLQSSGPVQNCSTFNPATFWPRTGISRKALFAVNNCAPDTNANATAGFDWSIDEV